MSSAQLLLLWTYSQQPSVRKAKTARLDGLGNQALLGRDY